MITRKGKRYLDYLAAHPDATAAEIAQNVDPPTTAHVVRCWLYYNGVEHAPARRGVKPTAVATYQTGIAEAAADPMLPLKDVAAQYGVTEKTISRAARLAGYSRHDAVRARRAELVAYALAHPEASWEELAEEFSPWCPEYCREIVRQAGDKTRRAMKRPQRVPAEVRRV